MSAAYLTIAAKLKSEVAPAGHAWKLSLEAAPSRVLHQADGSHPNPTGSYLAALTFYAVIADRTPEGLPGRVDALGQTLVDLPAAETLALQKIAWRAVADTRRGLRVLKDKR